MKQTQIKAGSLFFGGSQYISKAEYNKLAERVRVAEFKLRKKTLRLASKLATDAIHSVSDTGYHSDDPRQLSFEFDAQ